MMHSILICFQIAAALGVFTSSVYYLLCLWSAAGFLQSLKQPGESARTTQAAPPVVGESAPFLPPVSILKPLKGIDPEILESFRSHCRQDYPEYEIIFGTSDANDPAIKSVKSLRNEFPERRIELILCTKNLGANVKVSNLAQMLDAARFDHLIVNDSDIRVEPDYLRRVIAPLQDRHVGMVTCPYRGVADETMGSRLEALGIATDFFPGVLVAHKIESGIHFGLGSTLAFRRADLEKIGGFISFVDYLADDYELGKSIASVGLAVELSDVVVETFVPPYSLRDFFAHQLRWARGVRDARAEGYLGLIFTFGLFWAVLGLAASGAASRFRLTWIILLAWILVARGAVALLVGWKILRDPQVLRFWWMIPLRDLLAVAIWVASLAGHTVTWRGDRFFLKKGKLSRVS